jgi:hypothetical protein
MVGSQGSASAFGAGSAFRDVFPCHVTQGPVDVHCGLFAAQLFACTVGITTSCLVLAVGGAGAGRRSNSVTRSGAYQLRVTPLDARQCHRFVAMVAVGLSNMSKHLGP